MKTDLLLSWANRIEAAIERQQKREPAKRIGFNMGSFMSSNGALTNHANYACGTTACLAGWILHLDYDLENEHDFQVFLRGVGARNSLLEHSFENLILELAKAGYQVFAVDPDGVLDTRDVEDLVVRLNSIEELVPTS